MRKRKKTRTEKKKMNWNRGRRRRWLEGGPGGDRSCYNHSTTGIGVSSPFLLIRLPPASLSVAPGLHNRLTSCSVRAEQEAETRY